MHTYGWRGVLLSSPTATQGHQTTAASQIAHAVDALTYSFIPMPLIHYLRVGPFSSPSMGWLTVNGALEIPFNTYPGALGIACSIFLLRRYRAARLSLEARRLGWCIAVCTAIGSVLLDPTDLYGGAAADAMAGTVGVGIALAAALVPAGAGRALRLAAGLEMLAVCALYLGYLSVGTWAQDPNTHVLAGMGQQMLSALLGPWGIAVLAVAIAAVTAAGMGVLDRPASGRRLAAQAA
jgi:hypothetical protein